MKSNYLLIAASLLMVSTVAVAGFVQPAEVAVTINADNSGNASGDMVTARFANDDVSMIGCGTRLIDGGDHGDIIYGFCQASNSSGVHGSCFTMEADKISIIENVSAFSYISFSWDENWECLDVGVSTQSFYIPESLNSSN